MVVFGSSVGESSGLKPNRTVAKHIPGPNAQLEQAGARASSAASEISRAHMLVLERGDKLSQLEDRTERMSNQVTTQHNTHTIFHYPSIPQLNNHVGLTLIGRTPMVLQ